MFSYDFRADGVNAFSETPFCKNSHHIETSLLLLPYKSIYEILLKGFSERTIIRLNSLNIKSQIWR